MTRLFRWLLSALFFCSSLVLWAQDFTLTLIHVNDTHSRYEPALTKLQVDLGGTVKTKALTVELGGYAPVAETIASLRKTSVHPLVLHAGDLFQGTLLFTRYDGIADTDFWNLVGLDAAVLGNHEFDKGPGVLKSNLLNRAKFPIVDANIDWSKDPVLGSVPARPYTVLTVDGQKIGVIGATTETTAFISSPGPDVKFTDAVTAVQKAADELTAQGVTKIILLSHLGFNADRFLATHVSGVDVVVGGHSHTLLGPGAGYGLHPEADYPWAAKDLAGNPVLVVQSWEWGKVVGDLQVTFDAKGRVQSWKSQPVLAAGDRFFRLTGVPDSTGAPKNIQWTQGALTVFDGQTYQPVASSADRALFQGYFDTALGALKKDPAIRLTAGDPVAQALVDSYARPLAEFKNQPVTVLPSDLHRGLNRGPGLLIADSMAAKAGTLLALANPGGVRTDLAQGTLTVGGVYELSPFGNTLVIVSLPGTGLVAALEDGIDFSLSSLGPRFPANPLIYVSGLRFQVNPQKPKGQRVSGVLVRQSSGDYVPLDLQAVYRVTVNNYMANGGDRYDTLKGAAEKIDTGFIDAEALMEYLKKGRLEGSGSQIEVVN